MNKNSRSLQFNLIKSQVFKTGHPEDICLKNLLHLLIQPYYVGRPCLIILTVLKIKQK